MLKHICPPIAIACLLVLGGCSSQVHEANEKYVLVAAHTRIPYWQEAYAGLRRAGTEMHVKVDMVGPERYDAKAEQEAFEEAGIKGTIASSTPLGMYTYSKTLGSGEARGATVEVYLLKVERQVKNWPERQERKLAWVSAKKAVSRVEEPGVVPLLLRLVEIAGDLS